MPDRNDRLAKEITKTVMGWIREHKIPRWGESTNIIAAIIAKYRDDEGDDRIFINHIENHLDPESNEVAVCKICGLTAEEIIADAHNHHPSEPSPSLQKRAEEADITNCKRQIQEIVDAWQKSPRGLPDVVGGTAYECLLTLAQRAIDFAAGMGTQGSGDAIRQINNWLDLWKGVDDSVKLSHIRDIVRKYLDQPAQQPAGGGGFHEYDNEPLPAPFCRLCSDQKVLHRDGHYYCVKCDFAGEGNPPAPEANGSVVEGIVGDLMTYVAVFATHSTKEQLERYGKLNELFRKALAPLVERAESFKNKYRSAMRCLEEWSVESHNDQKANITLTRRLSKAQDAKAAVIQQAQAWAMYARTQRAIAEDLTRRIAELEGAILKAVGKYRAFGDEGTWRCPWCGWAVGTGHNEDCIVATIKEVKDAGTE